MIDVVLITTNDLKEVTSISNAIKPDMLDPYLSIAQDFYVKEILGESLLAELQSQVTGNSLTSLNQALVTQYIRPLVAYAAWHEYIPFSAIKSMPTGEVRQTSDNSSSADMTELVFKRNALKEKVSFYQKRLKEYLDDNTGSYPLYRTTCSTSSNNWSIYLGSSN